MNTLNTISSEMVDSIISDNMPEAAVIQALEQHNFGDKNIYLVAIGKAAWTMARAASDYLGTRIVAGAVITKYDHAKGDLPRIKVFEAGHPIPDENTVIATQYVLNMVSGLSADDVVLFLVSGGGSALFEAPQEGITLEDLADLNGKLLASGADIVEINMIRKRFSKVKAGRFAELVRPASVFAVVLSDVLGDRLDSIASGPAAPDNATRADAEAVVAKYGLTLNDIQQGYLARETPKQADNVETVITGSVRSLCDSAARVAGAAGFRPYVLTTVLNCEASEAGKFLGSIARDTAEGRNSFVKPCAIIAGGETVVTLKGSGLGGRNQELALSAALGISGLENTVVFSLGSDGTDGPTDAAGGIVDGTTTTRLKAAGIDIHQVLANNDSYQALKAVDGLIVTGPTGTNVNDISVILCS
ncbi:MAG: glycerate kinase [Promicromonosporaceae bacterium]|nr:glycerate kinase [Promicromonosporaceae bacterium]